MLKAGQTFAHFKIINKLGEGGMGAVYLAEDQKLHRKVALKTLTGEFFGDVERLERFRREARTAAQISNAYVMSTYDIGEAPDEETQAAINYIVLEYVEGRPLGEYIKEERPDLSHLVRLAEKVATGIAAAHKLNIVHRDIKPDNVLVDDNGDPKILDFGLAKPVEPVKMEGGGEGTRTVSDELTKVGKIMGTVSYMSPEQVKGEKVDTRSDIFAFGVLLYRMVTGEMPFTGPSQVETMAKILEASFPAPSIKNDQVPPELERIITKCLQKDPEERYQSSRDLVVDLRNVRRQYDSGLSDSVSGLTTRTMPRAKRRGTVGIVIGALVVVVAGVLLYQYLTPESGSGIPHGVQAGTNTLGILGFENKTGDQQYDWLETGLPEILLTDLSQKQPAPIISQQRILDCLDVDKKADHTHEECVKAARSLGVTRLLQGSLIRLGDKIRIDARVEDAATGQIIMAEKVVGDDPYVLVDSLTAKVGQLLNIAPSGGLESLVSSPEAFKEYHLGMEHFWAGRYDDAVDAFKRAIAIDSTFALPYMRIGMANVFQGRRPEGVAAFMEAKQLEGGLPTRERSLLDAYIDTWVHNNFSEAFIKMSTLVQNYPDDAEIRTIYALFIDTFQRDTVAVFAQLDTVMRVYPTYPFALEQRAQLAYKYGKYDDAITYNERLQRLLPNALDPQVQLVRLYTRQGRREEAWSLAQRLHEQFPDAEAPLFRLMSLAILRRDFKAARDYTEALRSCKPDDPYTLIDYYDNRANLACWEGHLKDCLSFLRKRAEQSLKCNDSTQITGSYMAMAYFYREFQVWDSVRPTAWKAWKYAGRFTKFSYPLWLVGSDRALADSARPLMKTSVNEFKAGVPKDFWPIADNLEELFESVAASDTVAMIACFKKISDRTPNVADDNRREMGILQVKYRRYEDGLGNLDVFVEGPYESISAITYLLSRYYMGVANDELQQRDEAIKNLNEVLKYWGKSDIQIDQIKDARARLDRLTG